MISVLINLVAVGSILAVAGGYHFGVLAAGNAFFGALSVLFLFTGFQLLSRDMPMMEALRSMALEPDSYPSEVLGYFAYIASALVSMGILATTASVL